MLSAQLEWYEFICNYVKGCTVIDVGAGTGRGVKMMLVAGASYAVGIDPNPHPPYVLEGRGENLPVNSYEWVTCVDVIEHLEEEEQVPFFEHLLKVAYVGVFLTTPNFDVYHGNNDSHPHEFSSAEFEELLTGLDYEMWNWDRSRPPYRVHRWVQCQNFGVIIRKEDQKDGNGN